MALRGSDLVLLWLVGEYERHLCYRDQYTDHYFVRLQSHDHSTHAFQSVIARAHPTRSDHLIDFLDVLYRVQNIHSRHEIPVPSLEDVADTRYHPVTVQLWRMHDSFLYVDDDARMHLRESQMPVPEPQVDFGRSMGSRTYYGLDDYSTYTMIFGLPYRPIPSPRSPTSSVGIELDSTYTARSPIRPPPGFLPRPIAPQDSIDDHRSRLTLEIDES
ncbi:hypothetical protein GOP47_0017673 [Adiantum capillus-veneris]|uniref:Uncharacterized protein n=1 Tax=Adiantum capillus-veneris TaxID=13818 RepID=A0A9D4UFX0_ADICA|nr:hypothetical protein GOP47_0017673 [Adiantum capillus-veneris]